MVDALSWSDRDQVARAGLLGLIASVVQVLASLSIVGFLSGAFDDIDFVAGIEVFGVVLFAFAGAICGAPGVVAALVVWRAGRGRVVLTLLIAVYLVWHVLGVISVEGWALVEERFFFQLPFGVGVDIVYQAAMSCLLVTVGALLVIAPKRQTAAVRVPFILPSGLPVVAGNRMEGPEPGGGSPKHLGRNNSQ